MKNKIIYPALLVMMLIANLGLSQTWDLLGNGGTSTITDFVGTTDPNPVQFGTNNIFPQMILDVSGYVGIGFVSPPRHLTITTQGITTLYGTTPAMTELLVAGGIRNDNTGRQTVADFQSVNDNSNSIGIRIRGSRDQNRDSDCGYVDFDNYYKTGNVDFNLARAFLLQ